jgi:hypothetical protein
MIQQEEGPEPTERGERLRPYTLGESPKGRNDWLRIESPLPSLLMLPREHSDVSKISEVFHSLATS